MDTGEHFKNNADYESRISAIFGRMRKRKDPLISALNQRVLGSSPSASTTSLTTSQTECRSGRCVAGAGLRYVGRFKPRVDLFRGLADLLARGVVALVERRLEQAVANATEARNAAE